MANGEKALHISFKKAARQHKVFAIVDCLVTAPTAAEAKRIVGDALESVASKIPGAVGAQVGTRHGTVNHRSKPKPKKEKSAFRPNNWPRQSKAATLDKDDIIKMYKDSDVSLKQIEKKHNISSNTIYRYLRLWKVIPPFAPVADDE